MDLLDKIIFIADYIEPRRDKAPYLDERRKEAFVDIDKAMYEILGDTLEYLNNNLGDIDPMTEKAYDYYKQLNDQKEATADGSFKEND
jgi:HD superfamily phosphohydrolase YqeK